MKTGSGGLRRVGLAAVQLAVGCALVAAAGLLLRECLTAAERQRLPPGFAVIRPPYEVTCLEVVGGTVWTGGKDGLVVVDRGSGTQVPAPAGAPELGRVNDLLTDRGDAVWLAGDRGAARWSGSRWSAFSGASGAPFSRAFSLLETRDGRIWVGGEGLIAIRDGDRWQLPALPADLAATSVDVLYQDRGGVVWVGSASPTRGGLWTFDGSSWQAIPLPLLPHPAVNMVTEERSGALWVATGFANRGGAACRRDGVWSTLTRRDGLAGEKVRSIFEDRAGRLWFGSEYDGVAVRDGGRLRVLGPGDGLAGREVKCMAEDDAGALWLGTDGGLTRVDRSAALDLVR